MKITPQEINDLKFEKARQKAQLLKMIRLEREKVARLTTRRGVGGKKLTSKASKPPKG